MKRLFVLSCPERLSPQQCQKVAADYKKVFEAVSIEAEVIVLDGGWALTEIPTDSPPVIEPETGGE